MKFCLTNTLSHRCAMQVIRELRVGRVGLGNAGGAALGAQGAPVEVFHNFRGVACMWGCFTASCPPVVAGTRAWETRILRAAEDCEGSAVATRIWSPQKTSLRSAHPCTEKSGNSCSELSSSAIKLAALRGTLPCKAHAADSIHTSVALLGSANSAEQPASRRAAKAF